MTVETFRAGNLPSELAAIPAVKPGSKQKTGARRAKRP